MTMVAIAAKNGGEGESCKGLALSFDRGRRHVFVKQEMYKRRATEKAAAITCQEE
jgi:hypothetical protein